MKEKHHYDLIIIGSGAGGGTLAYTLAATGLNILILERGDFLPREAENWSARSVFADNRYLPEEKWSDKNGNLFTPGNHYFVGGNTKFYGAALFRLREQDFGQISYEEGISPAWPISYKDLQPFYLEAEHLYSVHGQRGEDPAEPPESSPYPYPKVSHEPRIQEIYQQLKAKGLKPFHLPLGIRLNEENKAQSQCIRCATCDGFPCLVDAKSDAHTTCIQPALSYPNVEIKTNTLVTRLNTTPDGKHITEVVTKQNDRQVTYTADQFIVSCGAINSAALLLRSRSEAHPNGLANSSGLVGRNYMCHNNSAIISLSRLPNPTLFEKTIGINDFYSATQDHSEPLGHIQLLGKVQEAMLAPEAPFFTPTFTLDYVANHAVGWWITTEDLPLHENRIEITPNNQIRLNYTPTNRKNHTLLFEKLKQILHHIDCDEHVFASSYLLRQIEPLQAIAHQVGTCRFGEDPTKSVLRLDCRTHDIDNLYVVDGSFFPSSAAVNPGLTIIANAIRVGESLCTSWQLQREKPLAFKPEALYQFPERPLKQRVEAMSSS